MTEHRIIAPGFIELTCDVSGEPLLVRAAAILALRRHPETARSREVERDMSSATFAVSFRPYTEVILDVVHGRLDVRQTVEEINAKIVTTVSPFEDAMHTLMTGRR